MKVHFPITVRMLSRAFQTLDINKLIQLQNMTVIEAVENFSATKLG